MRMIMMLYFFSKIEKSLNTLPDFAGTVRRRAVSAARHHHLVDRYSGVPPPYIQYLSKSNNS